MAKIDSGDSLETAAGVLLSARTQRGLTQQQVADQAKTSKPHVHRLESGFVNFMASDPKLLWRVANALGGPALYEKVTAIAFKAWQERGRAAA